MPARESLAERASAPATFRAVDRIGLGPVMALLLLGLMSWTMKTDREAFLGALAKNSAAVEKLAAAVADNTSKDEAARALTRALCPIADARR